MVLQKNSSDLIKFPHIPEELKEKFGLSALNLRFFEFQKSVIDIDFDLRLKKPELITQILHKCMRDEEGKQLSVEFLWELPISKRIECLLTIALMAKSGEIEVPLECKKCHKSGWGIGFTQQTMKNHNDKKHYSETIVLHINDREIELRKPTGLDQLAWLPKTYTDKAVAIKEILRSLICNNEELTDEEFSILENSIKTTSQLMEEVDPLIYFKLSATCVWCKEEEIYNINLQEISLNALREAQKETLDCIHLLALNYHWNEQEILSLPEWRRKKYISRLDEVNL